MTTELANLPPPDAPTLARPDLVTAWEGDKLRSTVEGYRHDLKDFARFLDAETPGAAVELLLQLNGGEANALVLAYRNHQRAEPPEGRGLSSATVARRLAAIRSIVKLGRQLGRVAWAIEVKAPRAEKRKDVRGPNADEFSRVLRALTALGDGARGRRDRAIVYLLFGVALRRKEVVGLDLADVDFPDLKLSVLRKGKTEKVRLTMDAKVGRALESWVFHRGALPGPLFHRTDRPGVVTRLTGSAVWRVVSDLGRAAGLARGLWPHAFRHAAGTELAARTESAFDVKAGLGHSKVQTSMDYLDTADDRQAKAARLLGRRLR